MFIILEHLLYPFILIWYLRKYPVYLLQGWHRLEKYLNLEGFLEKSLKIKYALISTENSRKGLKKFLNSSTFCRN